MGKYYILDKKLELLHKILFIFIFLVRIFNNAYLFLGGHYSIRMQRHEENSKKIAKFLSKHPQVNSVIYPGLKD